MSTKFLSPGWRMPRNANQSKSSNYSLKGTSPNVRINILSPAEVGITSSFSFWLKRTNNTVVTQPYRVVGGGLYGFYMAGTSAIYVRYGAGAETFNSTNTQNALALTDWVHWVITRKEVTSTTQDVKLYANGNLVDSVNGTTLLGTLDSKVDSLMYQIQATDSMNSFAIFDYALSQSQVTTLYGNSTNGIGNPMALPSTPIAYYPLGTSAYNGEYLAENNAIGDYVFDFDNDNILINTLNLGTQSTESFWVKRTNSSSDLWLGRLGPSGSNQGGYPLYLTSSIIYTRITTSGGSKSISFSTPNDTWMHVCRVRNGNNVSVYVSYNGTFNQNSGTNSFTAFSGLENEDTIISEFTGGSANVYEASNWQFFNTALSSTDVETLYNYGSPIQTLANIPQSSNLKAWYKLDASEVYNSTSTEWTINNATSGYTKAFDFELNTASSADEYISIFPNNELNGLTNVTFAGWFYARATNEYDGIFTLGSGAGIFKIYPAYATSNTFRIRAFNQVSGITSYVNSNYVSINQWYHLAVVCESGSVLKIYINGQEETNTSGNNFTSIAQSTFFKIGSDGWTRNWNGLFSNFQVWDTGLSLTDAATLYNNGSPLQNLSDIPQNSNLKGWWKLDASATYDSSTTTWTIPDDSNNSNVGTSNAMTRANLVNSNVSALNGLSSGMSQANLIQSDLQTVAPYSKYAMKLDDATLSDYINVPNNSTLQITGNLTLSSWVKIDGSYISNGHLIAKQDSYVLKSNQSSLSNVPRFQVNDGSFHNLEGPSALSLDTWHHIAGVREGNSLKLYVNGALVASSTPTIGNLSVNTHPVQFNAYTSNYSSDLSLSNNAIWNIALNDSEIREVYNEGLPYDLNTFSGTAPISWWQLGENSSFDGSNWKYADEMTAGNNANSVNTAETALTNGVGTTANGVSASMGVGSLVGDAPYSDANAISSGMSVVSRVTGSGNTP